jgi:hypothetical protein
MAWKMSETAQYAIMGRAVCTAASEAQETSWGSGLSVYSGRGGRSYEVTLLAMAAVVCVGVCMYVCVDVWCSARCAGL